MAMTRKQFAKEFAADLTDVAVGDTPAGAYGNWLTALPSYSERWAP